MAFNNLIALTFLSAIPVIVALYLLRLQRKKKIIASTFFWTEMIQDLQANVPFQKLRWNILLFLQLLIAMAIIFAMVDPSIKAALNEGQRTIFVIDTSASMSAAKNGQTRLEKALQDIGTYCNALSPREEVMLIEAGEHAQVILDFTSNLNTIQNTLNGLRVQDTRSDMETAYRLAVSKAGEVDQPKIIIAGDFSGIDAALFADPSIPIQFLQAGEPGNNVAITDFSVTGISDNPDITAFNAFLAVRNFTDQAIQSDIDFLVNNELVDVRTIEVDPGSRMARVFNDIPYPAGSGGVVEVKLDIEDDMPLDNTAYSLPPDNSAMEVLIAGDDPFLQLALAGIPGIQLYKISANEYLPGANFDLTFFPGWAPEELLPGNYVFFNPPSRDYLPCTLSDPVPSPQVTDWDDGNPMLRFVNPGSFDVFTAKVAQPQPGAIILIDADTTPLLIYGERNYIRALVFPFELTSSDLITRPTFPILMYNIISFFRSHLESSTSGLRTQGIEAVRVDGLAEKVKLTGPGGIELEFPIDAGHAFVDVNVAGIYTMDVIGGSDSEPKTLVANFFDEEESDISAIAQPQDLFGSDNSMRFEIEGEKHVWKYLAAIALIVLSGEWFFYHRKGF
jgi:Ca-activated chloride channel homolog